MHGLHLLFCSSLIYCHITQFEKDLKANCLAIRAFFKELVNKRKQLMEKDPEAAALKQDLLSILLTDELFKNDSEMIIDETLTFFLAGT